ncbi:Flp family type IVb pilin [Actinoplanes derwentensis]|uniref:Flp family type IVb pilin n=1 Tax=Actinoplanes derwentensis TaxID=113562 RepID=UPI000B886B71|nr:Flp family type IVb pilin [Actinoplanes derwentensis]GID86891.1 hypothetical protein Ade03nite_58150 [Actinoplanes derwentensis]
MEQIKFLLGYLRSMHKSEEGATIVEYSLLVALIAAALITAIGLLSDNIESLLGRVTGSLL